MLEMTECFFYSLPILQYCNIARWVPQVPKWLVHMCKYI